MIDFSHGKYPPFKHQIEDANELTRHPFYFIASEMRTGKTKIVIDGAQAMYHAGLINRVIVIAPEPVRGVWVGATSTELGGELSEHLWAITPALVTEFHSRVHQWRVGPVSDTPLRIIVTNYEFVRPYRRKNSATKNTDTLNRLLQYCTPHTLLVLDEASAITNHTSEQFDSCFKLRQKCGRVVLLDGAPMDTPLNLFAIARMLSDSILDCKFITHYKQRYAVEAPVVSARTGQQLLTKYKKGITKVVDWKNLDDIQRRFAPYTIRRLQKDCPDMPVKLPAVTLKATLTARTWEKYRNMRDDMVITFDDGNITSASQAIVKFMRLSQITGGFVGGIGDAGIDPPCPTCDGHGCEDCEGSGIGAAQPSDEVREIGREKLDVLLWLIGHRLEADPRMKMIVWARFSPETRRIILAAEEKFPHIIVAGLHGGQTKADRARTKALLDPRTAPDGPVLAVGTLGVGAFGLDMSASHTSVNYSYDHSLRKFLQSGDRVYGPRQKHPVEYFDIVAVGPTGQKTYDAVVVQARRDKHELATWTTDAWVKALRDD